MLFFFLGSVYSCPPGRGQSFFFTHTPAHEFAACSVGSEMSRRIRLRPISWWPFPTKAIAAYAEKVKGMLSVELNAGQMVEDVRLAVNGKVKVEHFGRLGGIVFTPDEVLNALKKNFEL